MTREQLEHAIRAACDISKDSELWIFGSQAILGQFPNAPQELCTSIELDVRPKNNSAVSEIIEGSCGEFSHFHNLHGFYIHVVSPEKTVLPLGWEDRVIAVQDEIATRGNIGLCLEVHDLTVSKLSAFRPQDKTYIRTATAQDMPIKYLP